MAAKSTSIMQIVYAERNSITGAWLHANDMQLKGGERQSGDGIAAVVETGKWMAAAMD